MKPNKVVLAYSGGLDTAVIIPWLKENYGCEVIAMAGDLGQGEELEGVREKALSTGASKIHVKDLRQEFVRDYLWKLVRTGAVYEGKYLLGTSIARPLLAKCQVEVALTEGADAVAHGCTGKGNDQVRFELTYQALAPHLRVIAPWREWDIRSREDALEYARQRNVPVSASVEKIYSRDRNIWHMSHEGGVLEDSDSPTPDDVWVLSNSPRAAPDEPGRVTIGFEQGSPASLDGQQLNPVELLEKLNQLGGRHGIGRVDLVENRFVGMKSRGLYETPGGAILYAAHAELEALCLDRATLAYKQHVALDYGQMVYNGLWFTPLREALDAFVDSTQQVVTGEVTLELYRGNLQVLGRRSPYSLYSTEIASFTMGESYNQKDAEGFIRILGLPLRVRAALRAKAGGAKQKSRAKKP